MLKYFILLNLTFNYITLIGQKVVLNYSPEIATNANPKKTSYKSYVTTDNKTEKTTVILNNNQNVEYLLLNKDFKVESKFIADNGLENTVFKAFSYRYLTGTTNELGSCFFFYVKDKSMHNGKEHLRMEIVNFNNKTISRKEFEDSEEETNIDYFTNEGKFYLLNSNDKQSKLILHVIDEKGHMLSKSMSVDLNGYNREKLTLSEYFSYSHVFYPGEETELIASTDLTKLYIYPEKVVIIVANNNEPPHVWGIDTKSYTVSKRKFNLKGFSGFDGGKEKFYTSSYLYNDNLYVLNNSKQKIEVGIFNLNTGEPLKKYEITESSTLPFLETPVEITTKGRLSKKNVITSDKELIKELYKGSNGIAVAKNQNGQLILTCGSYDKEKRSVTVPTGPTPGMPMYYSRFSARNNNKTFNYDYSRTVNFRITIEPSNFNIISNNSQISNLDKINSYLEKMPQQTQAENIFSIGDHYFLCYYDISKKSFSVIEMPK